VTCGTGHWLPGLRSRGRLSTRPGTSQAVRHAPERYNRGWVERKGSASRGDECMGGVGWGASAKLSLAHMCLAHKHVAR
jgi:hypothetical protein